MKVHFQITSDEFGMVLLRRRKIAKALRWWLRQNGFTYKQSYFCN
jgi:diadenosine tetraphosphate (Ap4A) HIT family hydrolase